MKSVLSTLRHLAGRTVAVRMASCGALFALLAAPTFPIVPDAASGANTSASALPPSLARELDQLTVQPSALIDTGEYSAEQRNALIPIVDRSAGLARPFRASGGGTASYNTALYCLTEAIYYEAANESIAGKRGVAQVILNRVAHPAYPASVCGVVYQGWDQPVCQFSYTCDGSLARAPVRHFWRQSAEVAKAALSGYVEKSVGTATHYHADYVLPYWAYRLEKVHVEGRHIFYRFPGRSGHSSRFFARWNAREFHPEFDPGRFATAAADMPDASAAALPAHLQRIPTEHRADSDIGGRLDPTSGWRLAIPDPAAASRGLQATLEQQRLDATPTRPVETSGNPLP